MALKTLQYCPIAGTMVQYLRDDRGMIQSNLSQTVKNLYYTLLHYVVGGWGGGGCEGK